MRDPVVPTREWRELYAALDCDLVAAALHPHYTASQREFSKAGRATIGSAPVGVEGTVRWLEQVAEHLNLNKETLSKHCDELRNSISAVIAEHPIDARITLSGYEGLRAARRAPTDRMWRRRALRRDGLCEHAMVCRRQRAWLEARGVEIRFRASLEDDVSAIDFLKPDLAIGTTPVVQHAKEHHIPGLYFTNLISARPLMGPAGAGSLAGIVNGAIENKHRFETMEAFLRV